MSVKKKGKIYAIVLLVQKILGNIFNVNMFARLPCWLKSEAHEILIKNENLLFCSLEGKFVEGNNSKNSKHKKVGRLLLCERILNDFHCSKPRSKIFDMEKLGL